MRENLIFDFRETGTAGSDVLGGKGFGLAKMTQNGIPVPPSFIVSTKACLAYYKNSASLPEEFWASFDERLAALEIQTEKQFGQGSEPLLPRRLSRRNSA